MEVAQVVDLARKQAQSRWRWGSCAVLIIGSAWCGCTERIRPPVHSETNNSLSSTTALTNAGSEGQLPVEEPDSTPSASAQEPVAVTERQFGSLRSAEPSDKNCSTEDAAKWLRAKAEYRPAGEGYTQIIQGQDYASIEAIRALYIEASGTTKLGEFGIEDPHEGKAGASKIVITSSRKTSDIELLESRIKIGQQSFADSRTILLFQTLARLLSELGSQCKQQGIRGRHLGTRAYRDDVRIEFSYGHVVVSLEGASNGRSNPERLYILDLIESKSSVLWSEARAASEQKTR